MEFQILNAANSIEKNLWLTKLNRIPDPRRDVYFRPEYVQAYVDSAGVDACCAVCEQNEAILIYPFLKSVVGREADPLVHLHLKDIQSAYGYGGPVVNSAGEDPCFLQQAWERFSDWCLSERIVTEFTRFHPLIDNAKWASKKMVVFKDRMTIPIDLELYQEELRSSSYYRSHRQMLNKANRMGFSFHIMTAVNELSWFVPLYLKTQDSLNATNSTRFGENYFRFLTESLGESVWLGVVKQVNEIVGAVLVLEGPAYLHSHLMGYRRDMKTAGMTNLLYHGIALEGAVRRKKFLHMGGGASSKEDDSLFRFKESLSPKRSDFSLGTLCHNHTWYEELGNEWERRNGPRPPNYFQFYRLSGQGRQE